MTTPDNEQPTEAEVQAMLALSMAIGNAVSNAALPPGWVITSFYDALFTYLANNCRNKAHARNVFVNTYGIALHGFDKTDISDFKPRVH